ncbi:putative zinc finger protein, partial [Orchesella cincta]
ETDPTEPETLCEKCGIDFLDEQSRKLHERRHELTSTADNDASKGAKASVTKRFFRTYVCSTCSYTCATKKMMMQHQRAHTGFELVCKAENCMFSTPFDNTLKEHIQNDHGTEENVRCPHCGLRMPSNSAFTTHWRFHHQTICSLCVNIYRVRYDVKENDIHDVICKIPASSMSSSDPDSSLLFKMESM